MDHKNRGKCVIFNHHSFDDIGLRERKATHKDVNALVICFEKFGFEVVIFNDLTAQEIDLGLKTCKLYID